MKKYQRLWAVFGTWACLLLSPVTAITINLQYPAGTLFSAAHDETAKNAINKAAQDLSAAITSNLSAINTDVYTGTNGNATVTYNWYYELIDPSSTGSITVDPATIAVNSVRFHVGARSFFGGAADDTLGVGGPGSLGLGEGSGYSYINPSQLVGAAAAANASSEVAYKRGGGPVIDNVFLSNDVAGVTVNTDVDFGVGYGSLSLDWDGNNNGTKDTDAQLNDYWHFNHNTSVAAGKNDLYSVALHEMLHALGIGSSESWEAKNPLATRNWTGSNVIALMGSGMNLLNPDVDHITEGTLSTHYLTGAGQEAAMDPTILQGTRKSLTALDLAFLRDIGYNTIDWVTPSFSPADFDEDGDVDGSDLLTWRNSYGANANGDTNGDGDTDGRDFLVWQREYTGAMLTATVAVPEPSASVLIVMSLALLGQRRRSR